MDRVSTCRWQLVSNHVELNAFEWSVACEGVALELLSWVELRWQIHSSKLGLFLAAAIWLLRGQGALCAWGLRCLDDHIVRTRFVLSHNVGDVPRPVQALLIYGLGRGEDPLAWCFSMWPLPQPGLRSLRPYSSWFCFPLLSYVPSHCRSDSCQKAHARRLSELALGIYIFQAPTKLMPLWRVDVNVGGLKSFVHRFALWIHQQLLRLDNLMGWQGLWRIRVRRVWTCWKPKLDFLRYCSYYI